MSLETLIGGFSRDEQIVAMELLWKRLTTEDPSAAPPEWHRSVVAERVSAIERGQELLSVWADAKKRFADRLR
ncbi:MAG TPA: addiction module protein [Pirellulaceae bacterium]|nr:addiction module protein [Pirellulaceae bacterium]